MVSWVVSSDVTAVVASVVAAELGCVDMTVVASVVAAVEAAVVTSVVGALVPENDLHHVVISLRNHYFFQVIL